MAFSIIYNLILTLGKTFCTRKFAFLYWMSQSWLSYDYAVHHNAKCHRRYVECHITAWHYAYCHYADSHLLSVWMLSDVLLNVVAPWKGTARFMSWISSCGKAVKMWHLSRTVLCLLQQQARAQRHLAKRCLAERQLAKLHERLEFWNRYEFHF